MANKMKLIFIILRPFGLLYSLIMSLRLRLYESGYFRTASLDVPVISVGNLTMGGSGKTPLVVYLAKLCRENDLKPVVVSRGYKGKAKKPVNIVSDGKTIFLSAEDAGDEPRMIAESIPGTIVLTGKKRVDPGQYAVAEMGSNVIILDDGFQHLALHRDVDIVLFNTSELYNNFHVFPGGVLRESFAALNRASCVCLTGSNHGKIKDINKFISFLEKTFPTLPLFQLVTQVKYFIDTEGKQISRDSINSPIVAFCGIASPERFQKTLRNLSLETAEFRQYPDHMVYTPEILDKLADIASQTGAKYLLTTEKDLVKVRDIESSIPILAVSIEFENNQEFNDFIIHRIGLSPVS